MIPLGDVVLLCSLKNPQDRFSCGAPRHHLHWDYEFSFEHRAEIHQDSGRELRKVVAVCKRCAVAGSRSIAGGVSTSSVGLWKNGRVRERSVYPERRGRASLAQARRRHEW